MLFINHNTLSSTPKSQIRIKKIRCVGCIAARGDGMSNDDHGVYHHDIRIGYLYSSFPRINGIYTAYTLIVVYILRAYNIIIILFTYISILCVYMYIRYYDYGCQRGSILIHIHINTYRHI